MSERHKPSFSLTTGRQRSILVSYLKKMGYIEWLARETLGLGEVLINYRCQVFSAIVESGQIINHFWYNKDNFMIAEKILQEISKQWELNIDILIIL